jgi:hypothetical protein
MQSLTGLSLLWFEVFAVALTRAHGCVMPDKAAVTENLEISIIFFERPENTARTLTFLLRLWGNFMSRHDKV